MVERGTAFVGFLIAAVAAFDWSPLLAMNFDTGFSTKQTAVIGGIMAVKGIFGEWARRLGTNDPMFGKSV